jgi:hypothetical protein
MLLVVVAMLSMLGIIALAIDVITLYSARSETQRAADAGALAAAKMLVDMGVTTDPTVTVPTVAQIDAATKAAQSAAINATIAGRQVQAGDVTLTFPGSGTGTFNVNPKVTVTVQDTNLPTFFARIWSRAALTVRASATAEGFNPSNSTSITPGTAVPVIARCVKPFIVPNCDPQHVGAGCGGTGATFFDVTSGAITNPGAAPAGVIGEGFNMMSNCGAGPGCAPGTPTVGAGPGGSTLYYYPAQMPAASNACPAVCTLGTNFEQDIECCNPTPISCGTTFTAPVVNSLLLDDTVLPESGSGPPAKSGIECLIHQSGGSGMDSLNSGSPLTYPLQISVGNDHPLAGTVLSAGDLVTTSDSLVTIPVYDETGVPTTPTNLTSVRVIGFLQVFIDRAFPGGGGPQAGEFHVTVVNVSGCGNSASGTPVASGSAVPIRLIHQ